MLLQYLLHNLPVMMGWFWRSITELYIQFVNYLSHISLSHEMLYIVGFITLLVLIAYELQYHLNRVIGDEAESQVVLDKARETKTQEEIAQLTRRFQNSQNLFYRRRWLYEGLYSIFAIAWLPFALPLILLRMAIRKLKQFFGREKEQRGNYLVVSTGPSYLFSLQIIVGIYVGAVLLDPILSSQSHLTAGASFWEFVFFGGNSAFASYLPLLHQPSLGLGLHFAGWTTLWWTLAQMIRLAKSGTVFVNNVNQISDVIHTKHQHDSELLQFQPGFLQSWRDNSGHRDAWTLSYANRWHKILLPIGAVSLLLGYMLLDADPYRLPTGLWVIALLSWVSVLLNANLQGRYSYEKPAEPVVPPGVEYRYGWAEVCALLQNKGATISHEHHFVPPDVTVKNTALQEVPFLNPLFGDLRTAEGEQWSLHPFQLELLNRFHGALQKYTTVTVTSGNTGDLSLNQKFIYDNHSDKREWLSIWPDGFGKTESIFIHACHFYLTTSQRTVILTRSNEQAERLHKRFEQMLAGNTLRWSIPIALADVEFYADVQDQYYPAVLIASVEQIGLNLLTKVSSRSDVPLTQYLSTVGMIQFDDLENYLGVIEQHTYFIFRRFLLQLYRARKMPYRSDSWKPFILGFSSDSMFNQRVWASSVLGVDFETYHPNVEIERSAKRVNLELPLKRFRKAMHERGRDIQFPDFGGRASTEGVESEGESDLASLMTALDNLLGLVLPDLDSEESGESNPEMIEEGEGKAPQNQNGVPAKPKETPEQRRKRQYDILLKELESISKEEKTNLPEEGHLIIKYNLNDFGDVTFYDIIALCEKLKVPWTYQVCGDGNRDVGIKNLFLDNEPIFFTPDFQSAAIVLLTGHYIDINRDLRSKLRIGTHFCQYSSKGVPQPTDGLTPIAVIAQYEQFEYELFTKSPKNPEQLNDVQRFPLPLVRKAGHWVLRTHLASDIVRFWLEVKDLVGVFGVDSGHIVQRLQVNNLLMLESRQVINEMASGYSKNVVVRAKRTALPRSKSDLKKSHLPLPLVSVEVASHKIVEIFDQSSSRVIDKVDLNSAVLKYYLGKIWATYYGHYVVKEYIFLDAVDENGHAQQELKKIIVEPTLEENISTPRRAFFFQESPNPTNEIEYRLFGDYGIGFALQSYAGDSSSESRYKKRTTQCIVRHEAIATLYLDAKNQGIKERRLLTRVESQQMKSLDDLHTDGLWVFPSYTPKEEVEAATLTLGAARICIAIWRMLLPNVYRGGGAVDLGIALEDATISLGQLDYVLTASDAMVLFDLQEEGSGVVHCIHREAILTLLEFTHSFIQSCTNLDIFMRSYDHCPDDSELYKGIKPLDWTSSREELIAWLQQVLPFEDGKDKPEPDPTPSTPVAPTGDPDAQELPLTLKDVYRGPVTPWADVAKTVLEQAPVNDVSSLLQVRLFSRDRAIESFIPTVSDVSVTPTSEGLNIQLPMSKSEATTTLISFFEAIAARDWASPVQVWSHLFQRAYDIKEWTWDTPKIGDHGPYAVMNPSEVQSVVHSVIENSGDVARSSLDVRIEALCRLFDWMHLNIRYEKDESLYSVEEYIAKPTETLKARAGDCEDHANVIASFALEIGLVPRITLLEGHALCEVYIGQSQSVDKKQVQQVVQQYMARRCQEFGLEFGQWPFSQGKVAEGWLLNGMEVTRQASATQFQFYRFDMSSFQILDDGEECWIVLDNCFGSPFVGGVQKHIEKGLINVGASRWNADQLHGYHYPSNRMIEEVRRRLFVTKNMDAEQPPQPMHLVWRGGLHTDGLQDFEVLKHLPTNWISPQQIMTEALSDSHQTQINEWTPPSEVTEAEDESSVKTPVDSEPVDSEEVPTENTASAEGEPSGAEEGDGSASTETETETTQSSTNVEHADAKTQSGEGVDGAEETPPPPPPCVVNVTDWSVCTSDSPTVDGAYGSQIQFSYKGETHTVQWGFAEEASLSRLETLQSVDEVRTPEVILAKELYPESLEALLKRLEVLYGGAIDTLFAEFVLSFVQALPTSIDGNLLSRTPSETILFGGSSADKALLLHAMLQIVAIDSYMLECDENRFACLLMGPFGGLHVAVQDIPSYFADVGHLLTGTGLCKWQSMAHYNQLNKVTWQTWPAQLFVVSTQQDAVYIQAFVPISDKALWAIVTNLATNEDHIVKIDITHTDSDLRRALIKLEIAEMQFDQWKLVITDGEHILGTLTNQAPSNVQVVEELWS